MKKILNFTLNGSLHQEAVADNMLLVDHLRSLGLTGTKTGCDGGECGACTVLVNGKPKLSCLTLAASVADAEVETIEALSTASELSDLQLAFHEKLGSQCGFCTPGFIMAAEGLLRATLTPTESEIREALGSNICRCTGYVKIIEAVDHTAKMRNGAASMRNGDAK